MTSHTSSTTYTHIIDAATAAAIEPNNWELVRNLGRVLNLDHTQRTLLLADNHMLQRTLVDEFGCDVTLHSGDMDQLPFADASFDSIIVARPVMGVLPPVARELARVAKMGGTLGMVVLHVHADYVADAPSTTNEPTDRAMARPIAAYRAVLAESGFTAFVNTPGQGNLLSTMRDVYRQYLLQPSAETQPAPPTTTQALHLLAAGGIVVALLTAEKAL